jgi:hypothetical protein
LRDTTLLNTAARHGGRFILNCGEVPDLQGFLLFGNFEPNQGA